MSAPTTILLPRRVLDALPFLSGNAAKTLLALASFMNRDGECWPSRAALGERAGVTRPKSVSAAIGRLVRAGLLVVRRRQRAVNLYAWADEAGVPSSDSLEGAETAPSRTVLDRAETAPSNNVLDRAENAPPKLLIGRKPPLLIGRKPPHGSSIREVTTTSSPSKRRSGTLTTPGNAPVTLGNGRDVWARWIDAHREKNRPDPISVGADTAAAKALASLVAKGELTADELWASIDRFLADEDPYVLRNGRPLRLLPGRLNAYRQADADPYYGLSPEDRRRAQEADARAAAASEWYAASGIEDQIAAQERAEAARKERQ